MADPISKLVRDRIPELFASPDDQVEQVAGDELVERLRAKLLEEVDEFLESGEVEELADIIEVCHALAAQAGARVDVLEGVRLAKRAERGGFDAGLVWTRSGSTDVGEG